LNAVPLESLFVLEKEQGVTKIHRVKDDPLVANSMKHGDQAGYLWQQGEFEGIGKRIASKVP
jgi:hypothetical protein